MMVRPRAQVRPSPSPMAIRSEPSPSAAAITSDIIDIKMTGNNFRFSPDTIDVKKGSRVRIDLTSIDMPHNFYVDAFKVEGPTAGPGETTSVEFTADQVGSFEFYCAIGQHRANGMVGTLTVTE